MTGVQLPHIAFIGGAGAGKTTASELLVKHYGYERLSFATPLKIMLGTTTDRSRLQEFGTDVVRSYEPDAWVNLFIHFMRLSEADSGWRGSPRFVVDDARFVNEVMRLRMEDFIVVRVTAHDAIRVMRLRANGKLQDESQLNHSSEHELDDFVADHTIANDDGPDVLLDQVVDVLNRLRR